MTTTDDVKRLLNYDQTLSLILNVNPADPENQANRPAWRIWAKNALRDMDERLKDDPQWSKARNRAEAFLADYEPTSRGLALFIHPEGEDTFEMPVPVENRADFGKPLVLPLLWQIDEYEPYLVVLVDQEEARFYTSYLGQTAFESSMEIDLDEYDFRERTLMPRSGAITGGYGLDQGRMRDAFEDMIEEHRARFYRDVAKQIKRAMSRGAFQRLVIGGAKEAAHALHNLLDESVQEQVVAVENIPMRTTPHELFQRLEPIALDYERRYEAALLDSVMGLAMANGGRGALGRDDVEQALIMQQVDLLLLPWPPAEGDDLLAERALLNNSGVELVRGPSADKLRESGGVAARLYYTV